MRCSIFRLTTDEHGFSKITINVPSSDLAAAVSLLTLLEKDLDVVFTEHLEF